MKTITLTFAEDGTTEIQTTGFAGRECQQATAEIERQLGVKLGDKVKTEMFQAKAQRAEAQSRS